MTSWLDPVVGVVFGLLGLALALVKGAPRRWSAALMIATGAVWLLGSAWPAATFLHRGPLVHLLAGYPTGRLRGWPSVLAVVLGYLDMVPTIGASPVATVVVAVGAVVGVADGRRRGPGLERPPRTTALAIACPVMGLLAAAAFAGLAGATVAPLALAGYELLLIAGAGGLFADCMWGRWTTSAITGLVVDLGDDAGGTVRDKLARALGDPSLQLGTIDPIDGAVVDEEGRPLSWSDRPAPGRSRTSVHADHTRIAVLDHDAAALADEALVGPVTTLAGLAVGNARIQLDIRHRMAEVEASRQTIVLAADSERRAMERALRAGALARLAEGLALLASAPDDPAAPTAELTLAVQRAIDAVIEFAHGVYPRVLDSAGLGPALTDLARRCPTAVGVSAPGGRLPSEVESTLYFVATEALTNAVKHAAASRVSIRLTIAGGRARLEVSDDGRGGADITKGTGLLGLADRLAVIGGRLEIDSEAGTGTRLIASAPVTAAVGTSGPVSGS